VAAEAPATPAAGGPAVILGAGYAGLALAREVDRRVRGAFPVVIIDRHPVHVLKTELYELGEMAKPGAPREKWALPIEKALDSREVEFRTGEVEAIDLGAREVRYGGGSIRYGSLAICLGSVTAYYNIAGARENSYEVYTLAGAERLAARLREVMAESPKLAPGKRPRILVVGGGSTGTEVAAEIVTTDWREVTGDPRVRDPGVLQVVGREPFLAGFPQGLVQRAMDLLRRAGVLLWEGANVVKVEPGRVELEDAGSIPFDVLIWCAGLQVPPVVRALPGPHGMGGRVKVNENLELLDTPNVFVAGDCADVRDAKTGGMIPATAQAALQEAPVAGRNLVHRRRGEPLETFRYRPQGVIVQVGHGKAAGTVRKLTLWSRPAALLKALSEREYAAAVERSAPPPSRGSL
jgi:NADH dehydrogenase